MKHIKDKLTSDTLNQIMDMLENNENINVKYFIIELLLEGYINMNKLRRKEIDENDFIEYCKNMKGNFPNIPDDLFDDTDEQVATELITFMVSINEYENNYRIIQIPNIYSLKLLVYSTLASFELIYGYEYYINYNGNDYYNLFKSYKEYGENKLYDEHYNLQELGLSIGDQLCIVYDNETEINIKVTDITPNDNEISDIILVKKHGVPFLYEDREIFELFYNDELDEFNTIYKNNADYEYLLDMYIKRNRKYPKYKFDNLIEDVFDSYEYDIDDDEYEEKATLIRNRDERKEQLQCLPHIQEYNYAKDLYEKVITKLFDYYQLHCDEFHLMASEMLKKNSQGSLPENIKLNSIRLDYSEQENLALSYILPINKNYKSVCEVFNEEKKLVLDEYYMLQSLMNVKFGAYRIIGYDLDNAIVLVEDIVTKEEFEIIDLNLSFGLDNDPNWPILCGRILTHNTRSFFISCMFMKESDEFNRYIDVLKNKDEYHSLEFFVNMFMIKNESM